jgi:flagellar FliJ protein
MAYKYKLETLLGIRQRIEEQVQYKLAHEIFVLDNHKLFLEKLRKERQKLIAEIEEKKRTTLPVSLYTFYCESLQNMDRQIEFQINTLQTQEHIVGQVRKELEEKSRDKQIVERMKEKDYLEYVREVTRKEHKELDELTVLRFGQGRIL